MWDLLPCAPPPEQDCGWSELPEVIPDWVLERAPLPEPLGCECGCTCGVDPAPVADVPVWAAPGVTGLSTTPVVSAAVAAVQTAVQRLVGVDPAGLTGAQALVDGEALLALEQQVRVLNLRRLADLSAPGLHELAGFRSAKSWLRTYRPDGDAADAALASQLRELTQVRGAVEVGLVPLAGARKVVLALRKVAPHVDRADGLIDGLPGDQVVTAVVQHVLSLICRTLQGLADDDPRLAVLLERAKQVLANGSQLWAALRAEAAHDPRNPVDTAAWADAEKDAWQVGADLPAARTPATAASAFTTLSRAC